MEKAAVGRHKLEVAEVRGQLGFIAIRVAYWSALDSDKCEKILQGLGRLRLRRLAAKAAAPHSYGVTSHDRRKDTSPRTQCHTNVSLSAVRTQMLTIEIVHPFEP